MDGLDENMQGGGPIKPIKVNEIEGMWTFLCSIDWTEPWFCGLGIFHVVCAILTIVTRNKGSLQSVYFGCLMFLVFFAEAINEWAAGNWKLFARQQYFDSNGLFISVVYSMPLLCNCLVIVVSWLWDVGHLISNVKELKFRMIARRRPNDSATASNQSDIEEKEEHSGEEKKEK